MLRQLWALWAPLFPSTKTPEGKSIHHSFMAGGYFIREVVPNQVSVLSTNSLYWFKENTLVNDCNTRHSAGAIQLSWMHDQLSMLRANQKQVIIIGHVPPKAFDNEVLYKPECYDQFVQLMGDFHDVIIGQFVMLFSGGCFPMFIDGQFTLYSMDTPTKM